MNSFFRLLKVGLSSFEGKLLEYELERIDTFLINETEGQPISGEDAGKQLGP